MAILEVKRNLLTVTNERIDEDCLDWQNEFFNNQETEKDDAEMLS
jgi:hypothetical protein